MDNKLYWEDFLLDETLVMGSHTFTETEIVEFARQFDPQPFHVDPLAAKDSFFQGLIASGWHTCAIGMRLMVDNYIGHSASLGSPGLDSVRWLVPVRPGDTLTYRRTTIATRPSDSRPTVGLVRTRWEALNQRDVIVMTMEGWGLFARRLP